MAVYTNICMRLILWTLCVLTSTTVNASQICKTQTCISVSDEISEFMDLTADPCEDFNQFACGGYLKTAEYDANTWDEPVTQTRARVEKLIRTKNKRADDFKVDQKVRHFYQACEKYKLQLEKTTNDVKNFRNQYLNLEEAKDKHLAKQFTNTLSRIGLKDWPYNENAVDVKDFRWYNVVPKMIEEGIVYTDGRIELPIINVDVGVNDLTKTENILKIDSPDFDDWDGNYWDDNNQKLKDVDYYMKLHFDRPKSLSKYINPASPETAILQILNRSIEIDEALWSISTETDRHDKATRDYGLGNYQQTTIAKLFPLPCGIDGPDCNPPKWSNFIDSLIVASGNKNNIMKTKTNQKVVVKDPNYFQHVNQKLQGLRIQPYEMANYIGFQILVDFIVGSRNVENAFRGNCVNYLISGYDDNQFTDDGLLNIAVGSMYAREYFDTNKKKDVLEMVAYIRNTFEALLPHIEWMDNDTKSNAIEKLQAMDQFIAYPEKMLDRTIMDEYYKDLNTSADDHLANIKNLGKFLVKTTYGKLGKSWETDSWTNSMAQVVKVVNAFYAPYTNQFVLPAGYLHHFNFNSHQPMYLNYPITGATIGHEIIHGFDSSGRNWDKKGIHQSPPGWWSNKTYEEYDTRANCVADFYSTLEVKELPEKPKIDGKLTLGENIADIGGNRLTYYAYESWVNDHGEEPLLPGLTDFNQRQLFWIRNAHQWCHKASENTLRRQLTGVHAPMSYRLIGSLMLSDEFARDFKCPKHSFMNPDRSCPIGSMWPQSPIKRTRERASDVRKLHGPFLPLIALFIVVILVT